jgi:GH15 family glucan-1,4-alpha-glucosidase
VFIALGADRASQDHATRDAFAGGTASHLTSSLTIDWKDGDRVTVILAPAATRAAALDLLARARTHGWDRLAGDARDATRRFLSRARLPDTDDPRVQLMARRALMNILTGMDRATGAIVASITTQPPYAQDWPRDGAFINVALDEAGFPDLVEKHSRFYFPLQRTEDESARRPAGSWAMNFYADGTPGGPIDFEIDNTSILVWSMIEHGWYLADPKPWLEEIYPTVKRTADLLVRWRDPETGLQAYANEDDKADFTRGLVGASSVRAALAASVRAAQTLGRADDATAWKARLDELDAAIATHLWDEAAGHFKETNPYFPTDNHGGAWIAWPAALWPAADARMARHLDHVWAGLDARLVRREGPGSSYDAKATLTLARLWTSAADRARLKGPLDVLLKDVPSPLGNYGEVYVDAPGGAWENRVAPPHLWEGALNYLAAVAFYGKRAPSGCGCSEGGGWSAALGLLLVFLRRR